MNGENMAKVMQAGAITLASVGYPGNGKYFPKSPVNRGAAIRLMVGVYKKVVFTARMAVNYLTVCLAYSQHGFRQRNQPIFIVLCFLNFQDAVL
jgi:hypothetical protein